MGVNIYRELVETYYDLQKLRVAVESRLVPRCTLKYTKRRGGRRVKRPCPFEDKNCDACEYLYTPKSETLEELRDILLKEEGKMRKQFESLVEELPIWNEWLKYVRGVGPVLALGLEAYIGDVTRFATVSKLWKYAGLAPNQIGKRRGGQVDYNIKLKVHVWKIATSLIRSKSKYADFYYKWKEEEKKKHPEITNIHAHNRAVRKLMKLFLAHYWEIGRRLAGLPSGKAYVIEVLGHKDYIPPIRDE